MSYDVVGIGNAIVDVISQTDESFLDHMGITKGIMQLVERERAETLYAAMDGRRQVPGGSVANTLVGLGYMGLTHGLHRARAGRRAGALLRRRDGAGRDRFRQRAAGRRSCRRRGR